MRFALLVPAIALLSACSVVPNSAWTFDPTRPEPKPVMAVADAVPINERVAQLTITKNEIRARIAAEPDARARQRHYEALHRVGKELAPLERRLALYASAR